MSDYIDRQAAIEIIQSMYPGMPRVPGMRKDWQKRYEPYIRMENAIRELPSAQLETPPYVAEIESEYEKWVSMPHINKPLAKALYEVWKKHDREDVSRNG